MSSIDERVIHCARCGHLYEGLLHHVNDEMKVLTGVCICCDEEHWQEIYDDYYEPNHTKENEV